MKQLLVGVISAFLSITVHADAMTLEKRQADATMNMTSLALGDEETVITAEGDMGVYGRVYVTYRLTYDEGRRSGAVTGLSLIHI